ncbi:MAG: outer membrane protein transport protein [Thermoanaerobaculia bacterium]|nr:outer membrane protein transport protein [Thermoanaerobaculia bacterium]
MTQSRTSLGLTLLALLATASSLLASGFAIPEQSAKASGLAGAWVAGADDAAANWYNPAALVWLDETEVQFGFNAITVGGDTEFLVNDPSFGVFQDTTFEPEGSIETPVHLYYAQKVGQRGAFGFGITTPFGLVTDWTERPVTFAAAKAELQTFVLNPNFAYQLTEYWSIAIGLDYILADIKSFSREVPIDLDGNPLNGFEVIGHSNLTGDGNDIGWNLAIHKKAPGLDFGLTYRSELTPTIEGTIDYDNFGPLASFFPSSPGSADLNLPAQAAIGIAVSPGGAWSYEFDINWTGWSTFDALVIDIENEVPGFSEDLFIPEDWDDTMAYRFGMARSSGNHEWRFGALFDEGAVPANRLRPSIPDADRTGGTIGFGFEGAKWNIDAYYLALFFSDQAAERTDAGSEGVVLGDYKSFANLAGLTFSRRF